MVERTPAHCDTLTMWNTDSHQGGCPSIHATVIMKYQLLQAPQPFRCFRATLADNMHANTWAETLRNKATPQGFRLQTDNRYVNVLKSLPETRGIPSLRRTRNDTKCCSNALKSSAVLATAAGLGLHTPVGVPDHAGPVLLLWVRPCPRPWHVRGSCVAPGWFIFFLPTGKASCTVAVLTC